MNPQVTACAASFCNSVAVRDSGTIGSTVCWWGWPWPRLGGERLGWQRGHSRSEDSGPTALRAQPLPGASHARPVGTSSVVRATFRAARASHVTGMAGEIDGGCMGEELVRRMYEASYRRLVGQLYAVCGDMTEAEDVVQEAFVRAVQHSRTFARVDNPEAWLRTAAVNVARSRFRRRRLGERLHRDQAGSAPPRRHPPDLSDDRLALITALRQLSEGQREAIALHYLADLPLHEVALAVKAPIGTVKARLSRGRVALAILLADLPAADADPDAASSRMKEAPHA